MRRRNLLGQTFNHWTALEKAPSKTGETYWCCRCKCGRKFTISTKSLLRGTSRSCGCAIGRERHGASYSIEYALWRRLFHRCTNPKNQDWHLYGGRGIKVDDSWSTFAKFFKDMGPRPSPQHSLDRYPDQSGPYSKDNCRWATAKEQARNMRANRLLTIKGETFCLAEWAERSGISRQVIEKRIDLLGWSLEEAVFRPVQGHKAWPIWTSRLLAWRGLDQDLSYRHGPNSAEPCQPQPGRPSCAPVDPSGAVHHRRT